MLKKTLLALSVAWSGTAAAASSDLDDVTMNIVNETAFQQIITADSAEIEKLLQENVNGSPVRTLVLRNFDGATVSAGTPIASGQVFSVSKELNQGMVSFSFVCAEDQAACEKRVEELSATNGFTLVGPLVSEPGQGTGITIIGDPSVLNDAVLTDGIGTQGQPIQVRPGEIPAGAVRVNDGAVGFQLGAPTP